MQGVKKRIKSIKIWSFNKKSVSLQEISSHETYIFLFLCTCFTIAYGQDKIAHLANMEDILADTTIVRYSSPNVVVMYSSYGTSNHIFHIVDTKNNMNTGRGYC